MPPVIAGVAFAIESAITAATGPTGTIEAPVKCEGNLLKVHGLLIPIDTPSDHLVITQPDGKEMNDGSITYYRRGVESEILPALPGVPIFGGDKRSKIGHITRAWIENNSVRIEGEVVDRPNIRFHIGNQECGPCLENVFEEPTIVRTGLAKPMKPSRVYVCVPGQAGYKETFVRFSDHRIKWPFSFPDPATSTWLNRF